MSIGRIASNIGHLLFNPKYTDKVTSYIKAGKKAYGYKNMHNYIGGAFKAADRAIITTPKANKTYTSLWKSMKNNLTSLPKDMKAMWKGTTGAWGKTKGVFKVLGKRMPVIGAGLMVAFELPNIISAFKDKGLVGGLVETGKSAGRLCGFMGGMAIGTAFGGVIGGLVGGFVGDWLVSKIVGKSHSEKKEEIAAAQEEQMAQMQAMMQPQYAQQSGTNPYAAIPQSTMTPQQLAYMQQQLYGGNLMNDDFMANATGMNRLNLQA